MTLGIFIGLSTIDIVYGVDEFPAGNTKVEAHSQDIYVGGPATNATAAFAHLGGKAALVTAVGRNAVANVIREELEKYSVQLVDLSPQFEGVPVLSSVSVDSHGKRNVVSANATRVTTRPAEVDQSLCEQARIVLVDGHYMHACQAWAAAARARGTPVVLDGGSWKDGTEELLKCVQTAVCSDSFLPPGCASRNEVVQFLKNCGVANIAITNGAEPVEFVSGQSSGTLTVPQVEVVDTMGAGDIFHGAYCYFASTGRGFIESLAEAAKVASESCRYAGTREWMRHVSPSDFEPDASGSNSNT
jgi:sugar/nucleoside kinase (ribokinase family)